MNKHEFEKKLRSIRRAERGLTPDPAWVLRTRASLMTQISNSASASPVSFAKRFRESFRPFGAPIRLLVLIRRQALAVFAIFGVVAGGSIMSVSAADNALPGDLLYPVKLAAEQTRLALTKDQTEKLKLKTEFVGRRTQEIKDIAALKVPQRQERLNEAVEIVKRDLDTVKTQLVQVSAQAPVTQAAEAAKLVDQQSNALVSTLKDVKATLPDNAKTKVTEAEIAAVNTGVKAVQVLIDTQANPETQGLVSHAELVQSINQKMQGLQDNVSEAAQKLGISVLVATSTRVQTGSTVSTSTQVAVLAPENAASSTPVAQIINAQQALAQTSQLIQENKLDLASDKLVESGKAVVTAEQVTDLTAAVASVNASSSTSGVSTQIPVSTSTASVIVNVTSTSVISGGVSSTTDIIVTSTQPLP
ncbi:MAG TPA: DUF5667 domain-containing protein [Patescibacteria group bacterium]|nr:DUF5667 domain-containing protein [Patescibacteria group bacterium]